jgi:BlaI family penicillinase repressor
MGFKELTKAEEQVMQIIWEKKRGFINDILAALPEPKPAYNTVSTIVRILEKKGFVGHNAFGKTHEYYALVNKETYTEGFLNRFLENYFQNSFGRLVSFFTNGKNLSLEELEEIRKILGEEMNKKPNHE